MPRLTLIERRIEADGSPESLRALLAALTQGLATYRPDERSGVHQRAAAPDRPGLSCCRVIVPAPPVALERRRAS